MITAINDRNFLYVMCCLLIVNFTYMPNPIFEPLSRYLSIEKPDYACMINGKWGSGKTYYLDKELPSLLEDKNLNFLYASANGVSSFANIAKDIVTEKIGFSKEGAKIVAHMFKFGANFIPGGKSLTEVDISDLTPFNDKDVVVIDDLERVHKDCDLIALLGQINSFFIEHKKIKTILVCDESEILRRYNSSDTNSAANDRKLIGTVPAYKASKEKCVRHTYLFENQLKPLLVGFINAENQISCNAIAFLGEQDNVNILFNRLEKFKDNSEEKDTSDSERISNLRVIKYIILSIGQVIDSISSDNHKRLIFNDLCQFVIGQTLYFKYADNSDLSIEITYSVKRLSVFNPIVIEQAKVRDRVTQWLMKKYNLESSELFKFESAAVRDLIFKGVYDKDSIKADIGSQIKSLGLDSPENADLQRFTHYCELEDSVFINLMACIDNHLSTNKFNLTQTISLITTIRQLITRGYMLPKFNSHKDVSDYFIKYINEEKTKSIDNFMTITDIKKEANTLKEKEYTPLKEKIEQLCEVRNISLDVEGIGIEVTEICLLSREFEERHLRILLNRMSQSDIDKIQSHYTFSNQFKRRFNNIVDDSKDWLTIQNLNDLKTFCSQSLTQLDQQSIGKLKVIDMIKVIDQFIKEKNDTSKLPANST